MASFSHFEEIWTDGIEDLGGGARDIKQRLLTVFTDGSKEWRYLGIAASDAPITACIVIKELPPKRFPTTFNDLTPGGDSLLHDMAIEAERRLLLK